ncbi:MAG: hypothetical protein EXR27_02915 [Betaproteobacteria bacterium]|nr:hypothetical protein [Betaproteobacteria bacterium]
MDTLSGFIDAVVQNWELLAYAVTTAGAGAVLLVQVLTIWKLKLEIEKLKAVVAKPDPLPQVVVATAADLQREIELRRARFEKERNKMHGWDAAGLMALSGALFANLPMLIYLLLGALTIAVGLAIIGMRLDRKQEVLLAKLSHRAANSAL